MRMTAASGSVASRPSARSMSSWWVHVSNARIDERVVAAVPGDALIGGQPVVQLGELGAGCAGTA